MNVETEDPRVVRNRRAVHRAALELLVLDGVSGLSVDRLAEVSGVSRSTIYRHWSDLPSLIVAAFDEAVHDRPERPEPTGELVVDLLAYLRDYAARLNDPTYAAVTIAILEWSWRDADFAATRALTFDDSRSRAAVLLRTAKANGEIRAELDVAQGVEDLVSPFLYRRLVLRRTVSDREVRLLHERLLASWAP